MVDLEGVKAATQRLVDELPRLRKVDRELADEVEDIVLMAYQYIAAREGRDA
jgi:hypothetical protein